MLSKKQNTIFTIIIVVLFIGLAINSFFASNTYYKEKFIAFDSSLQEGVITRIEIQAHDDNFRLNTSEEYYIFSSIVDENLNKYKFFYRVAEVGDSISKKRFSDTLYLFKRNGEKYAWTFHKH